MKRLDFADVKKIAVIRNDRVGDLILSTPFFRNLKEALPDVEITAIVNSYIEPILQNNPNIDRVALIPDNISFESRNKFVAMLKKNRYDIAIALSPNIASYLIALQSGAPYRYAYVYSDRILSHLFCHFIMTNYCVLDLRSSISKGRPVRHEVLQTFSILELLNIQPVEHPLEIFPNEDDLQHKVPKRFGIQISHKWLTPPWTIEDFLELMQAFLDADPEITLLMTYGSQDKEMADEVIYRIGGGRIRFLGEPSISKWAATIGTCSVFISPDTGSLHCASAMSVPVVAVYENKTYTHCSSQWAPWKVPYESIRKREPARTIADIVKSALFLYNPN